MAEAVVSYVLGRIGEAAYQEALSLYGLGEKIEWANRELKWVGAFLKDAEAKQNKDARMKQWVNDVREVAYMIEDALDKFLVEMGGGSEKGILQRARKLPKELRAKHTLVTEIDNITKRMSEIRENCIDFKIISIESSSTAPAKQPVKPVVIPEIDNTDIVGFKDDINKIRDLLLDHDQRDLWRSVISIVEAGGRGKTTVATKVYNSAEVERHFQIRIWLVISKEYQLIDVLKKMLQKLKGTDANIPQTDPKYFLITELHKSLKEKKYLVVLDDVWSTDLWIELEVALPEDKNGSRVLITTRDLKVAKSADARNKPYQLRILDEDESKKLLLKKAFPNQFATECPDNLLEQANQLAKKCGGWPLALVVLGGILSTRHPDYSTWDEIMSKLNWSTEGSDCMNIISTSYDDLSVHLKLCFMYFAAFPEDTEIRVSRLIRMWIAEGFIQQETKKEMEDTAKNYFEELVQRCLVQVSRQSQLGKMRDCRIHDILHELAINKAKENDFLMVYSKSTTANSTCATTTSARRAAYHEFDVTEPVGAQAIAIGSNLRSLISAGKGLPNCNALRMTRVLDLEDRSSNQGPIYLDLKWLQHLGITLRYLRIDFTRSRETNFSCLTHLKHLQSLEIIDLFHEEKSANNNNNTFLKKQYCSCLPCRKHSTTETDVHSADRYSELPSSFWHSKMLRHVIIYSSRDLEIMGPLSSANLENLLKLKWVIARKEWAVKLPRFPRIRKLSINLNLVKHCWEAISNLMIKLENLTSLSLYYEGQMEYPMITPAFADYKRMHSLTLSGTWPIENVVVDRSLLPPNLVKLILFYSEISKDPMPELEQLPLLRLLALCDQSYMGEKLSCSREGFRYLQLLKLYELPRLEELKIEEGALPMLNVLEISDCPKLKTVPDLQYLINLRELRLSLMSSLFLSRLKGEDQHKVKHVPSVEYNGWQI